MIENFSTWLSSPPVIRKVSSFCRRNMPIVRLGNNIGVFLAEDVDAALTNGDLGVTTNYAEKMQATTGPFFLGMEDGPQYQREHNFARMGVRASDTDRIREFVRERSQYYLQSKVHSDASEATPFDLVEDFSRRIMVDLIAHYFGVQGPDHATMAHWMRSIFWFLFLDFGNDPDVRADAVASSQALAPHLDDLIAQAKGRHTHQTPRNSFLDRLVEQQATDFQDLDDAAIRRNIGGVIVGAVDTQSKALALTVQELMRRPDVLADARAAADRNDDKALLGHVLEALRFNPHNPLIVRHAMRDTILAPGRTRETKIKTGTRVFAMTLSASFDPQRFPNPEQFNPTRPPSEYLHFGYGLHRCFGEKIVHIAVPEAIKHLLAYDFDCSGSIDNAIVYEGPFPNRFPLSIRPREAALGAA